MMNDQSHLLGLYQLPWFYFCDVEIYFKFTRRKVEFSYIFAEYSDEQKLSITNRYIDAKVNIGRKGILDALRARSQVVIQKETAATTAMVMKSIAASGNYLSHDFIPNPLIPRAFPMGIFVPCVLVTTRQISVSGSSTPYAYCRNHGFVTSLSIEQIRHSEDYTRVVTRSPKYQIVHRYRDDCVLEFHDDENRLVSILLRANQQVGHNKLKALKDGYLVYIEDRYKMCRKKLKEEDDIFLHGELRFCSRECRSGEKILNFERYLMVKDPYPYIRRPLRPSKNGRVLFYVGGCRITYRG